MLQIRRILQLLTKEKSPVNIAGELGISVNTVKKYRKTFRASSLSLSELLALDDCRLQELVYPPSPNSKGSLRQTKLLDLLPDYNKRLNTTHITRQLLWQEYIRDNPQGYSYSQFCEHISQFELKHKAVMHLEHKPGDVLQIDFAGDKLCYIDVNTGNKIYCPVLVCVLPFSSFCYVEALADMTQPQLIGALNRCLQYLGGVPANICSDNLKQVVTRADRYEPVFSELIDQFALYYNLSFTATRVVKPRDKASVERHVGIAYSRIYALVEQQNYDSFAALNQGILEQLDKLNDTPMQVKKHTRRAFFIAHEQPLLTALPAAPFEIKYQTSAKVMRNYHVILGQDWHNYSVPYRYIGKKVKLIYDTQNVEIYYNMTRIALHRRNYTKNGFTTINEHRPQNHQVAAQIQQYKPEDFKNQAKEVGEATYQLICHIIDQNFFSHQIFKTCLGILRLGQTRGTQRLEKAAEMALHAKSYTYKTIKNILENNRDKLSDKPQQTPITDQMHDNVRGADFFADISRN